MQETIIYGGAFNPPTLAHQAIVQACIEYAKPRGADVWLLPSASRRDKEIAAPREYRLELIRALLDDVDVGQVNVAVHTLELDRPELTETYTTVCELQRVYPERRFVWVFGSDSVVSMPTWNHGAWLAQNLPMLIVQRDDISYPTSTNCRVLGVTTRGFSSTELRRRLAAGELYDDLVGGAVAVLLRQKKYAY